MLNVVKTLGIPHIVWFLVSLSSVKVEGQQHMENKMCLQESASKLMLSPKSVLF